VTSTGGREARIVVACELRVFLKPFRGNKMLAGRAQNISSGGMFVACHDPIVPDSEVDIEIVLDELGTGAIKMMGWVAHAADDGMGIQFDTSNMAINAELMHLIALLKT
jgi:hypothetical protein